MKVWKLLGLAGLAGVAATGVVVARDTRRRARLTPEEVRERLHARAEAAGQSPAPSIVPEADRPATSHRASRRWRLWLPRPRPGWRWRGGHRVRS